MDRDFFMSAQAAKDYQLIDEIIGTTPASQGTGTGTTDRVGDGPAGTAGTDTGNGTAPA